MLCSVWATFWLSGAIRSWMASARSIEFFGLQQSAAVCTAQPPRLLSTRASLDGPGRQALLQGQGAPEVGLGFRQPSTPGSGDRRDP